MAIKKSEDKTNKTEDLSRTPGKAEGEDLSDAEVENKQKRQDRGTNDKQK